MSRTVYINLPVSDLPKSKAFFTALGLTFDARFTNEHAACVIVNDKTSVMLLTHGHFAGFAPRPIADATKTTEVLIALSCESRAEVDELVQKAVAAGGSIVTQPQDHGFMYGHGFADPDGHIWELGWMDPNAFPPQQS